VPTTTALARGLCARNLPGGELRDLLLTPAGRVEVLVGERQSERVSTV
jgi:hypothetical protein